MPVVRWEKSRGNAEIWSGLHLGRYGVAVGGAVLLLDAGGEPGFDDVDHFCGRDAGVD